MLLTPPSKNMIFNQALGLFGLFSYSYYSDKFLAALLNVQRYAEKDKKMHEDLEVRHLWKLFNEKDQKMIFSTKEEFLFNQKI